MICFHGTNEINAGKIMDEGFLVGTYFATHLEDALKFGGEYIFFVRFDERRFNNIEENSWQFHIVEQVAPNMIWQLVRYDQERLLFNPEVVEE